MKNFFYALIFMFLFSTTSWAQIAGDRTVPSPDYPTLQTVADSLNLYGVGEGGANFLVTGGSSFQESALTFIASGSANNPVHIGWDGVDEKPVVNFDGTEADGEAGITLNGVDNYTIDGLAITNSNSNLEYGILITNFDDLNGAHDNAVKNMSITLDKLNPFQTVGISAVALVEPTVFDGNNHNNTFYNNDISNVMIGYVFDGGTSTTEFMGVGNMVGTEGDGESIISDIVMAGITTRDQNGFTITNTTIRDLTRIGDGSTAPAAIATSSGNPSDPLTNEFNISNNTIEDMTSSFTSIFGMYLSARKVTYNVNNNKISNITATGGGSNSSDGIMVLASSAIANIYNNMVSGIAAPASAVNNNAASRGITVRTYDQANVFYNSVLLEYEATNPAHTSAAFVIYSNSDPVQMRNNIFVNKTTLAADATGIATAIFKRNNTWAGIMTETDNNIYYAGEPSAQHVIYYGNNSSAPNVQQTMAEYIVAADSLDQNSYTEDVPFESADNLHIQATAVSVAQNNGMPVTTPIAITTDIDGNLRNTETPDIGADEYDDPPLGFLTGVRNVPSDDYPDLQTIADSLNTYHVGPGGVSFMLAGGSTYEESPIEITGIGNTGEPVFIGWDGVGEKPSANFDGTEADGEAGITLNGVDNYTIDGLAITNTNSNIEYGILITNFDDLNGAHDNAVKNMSITLDKLNPFQTVGISAVALVEPTVFDGNNHNNTFYNNDISNVMIGYVFDGGTSTTEFMGVGNMVGTEGDGESIISDIVMAGITTRDQNGFTITNTTIRDLTRIGDGSTAPAAIATSSGNPSDPLTNEFNISNNTIEDMTSSFTSIFGMYLSARKVTYNVNNNKISNITATGGGSNSSDGIMVLASSAIANIYNNMVSGIAAPASAVNNNAASRGITVRTYDQANVFYNSVLLEYEATNPAHTSAAFVIYSNSDPVQMRNNIFVNKTTLAADATGIATAIFKRNNTWAGIMTETDNNIYYAGEPSAQHVIYYGNNSSAPNVQQTMAEYIVAADSLDQNSYTEDVPFESADNLHIPASANTVANNNAMPVNEPIAITTDFDGELRNTETPDIGADEIISLVPTLAINPNPEDGAIDVSLDLTELSWEYFTNAEYALPEAFLVYLNESPDFDGVEPVATVMWEEGVNSYSATIGALNSETLYYWKVVPVTSLDGGVSPDPVTVWTFTTEVFVFPYPNAAENPTPEDGGIMDITDANITTFSWDYIPAADHSLPDHFEIYGATFTNTVAWTNPIAEISYVDGQVSYTIEFANIPNFTYELGIDHFWKIVPVAADDQATPDVPVWAFTFDLNNGVNDLSSVGTVIYPNPAVEYINIEPGFEGKYEVILYDMQGRLVKHFSENEGICILDIASVQSGAYQLVVKQGESQFARLIKVN